MAMHNITGIQGEARAAEFFRSKGYVVLEVNWRHGKAEVDLVVEKEGVLVFVEVKTRSSDLYGEAHEAVGLKKQQMLLLAAEAYLEEKGRDAEVRFDVVSITQSKLEHIEDAFSGHM